MSLGLSRGFNDTSAAATTASGGFDQVLTQGSTKDVLVLSDVDHSSNGALFPSVFNPEKLQSFADKGFTDIHLEIMPSHQYYIDSFIQGTLTRDEFIAHLTDEPITKHITGEQLDIHHQNFTDFLEAAAHTDPPLEIHASYIKPSNPRLFEEHAELTAQLDAKADDLQTLEGSFKTLAVSQGLDGTTFDEMLSQAKKVDVREMEEKIINTFSGQLPEEALTRFADEVQAIHMDAMSIQAMQAQNIMRARIESDAGLASTIAGSIEAGGKALVVHGAAHGATAHDLDEHLTNHGLSSQRVLLAFDPDELSRFQHGEVVAEVNELWNIRMAVPDLPDQVYYPLDDRLEMVDWNKDDTVEIAQESVVNERAETLTLG